MKWQSFFTTGNNMSNHKRTTRHTLLSLTACALLSLTPAPCAAQETDEPVFSSVEERRLFQEIHDERAKLRDDKKEIELQKKELKSLEEAVDKKLADIDNKLDELKKTQRRLESLMARKTQEEIKRTQDLARIYEKMTPQKAALAISGLEKQLAADLLAAMKTKAAAKILDQITRQKATELSTTFSTIQLE